MCETYRWGGVSKVSMGNPAPGKRTSYWGARNQWVTFAEQSGHSFWLAPSDDGKWGKNSAECLFPRAQSMRRKAGIARAKLSAARYFYMANGEGDFAPTCSRIKTLLKGVGKREDPNAMRPYNVELIAHMQKEVTSQTGQRNVETETLFAATVFGSFSYLRFQNYHNCAKRI